LKSGAERLTREDSIALLRRSLLELQEIGKSMCQIAAERKIFCGGFLRYTDDKLRHRYAQIVAQNPSISRAELESAANEWQLRRQAEAETALSCDVQWRFYETCHGWDDFTNSELEQFCLEIANHHVEISGMKTLPVI
jgi:hypothetical protein